ncbi:MAG: M28 family peptidase [Pirellulaceae bacterium]
MKNSAPAKTRPDRATVFLGSSLAIAGILVLYLAVFHRNGHAEPDQLAQQTRISPQNYFDGQQAHRYLEQLCALGSRTSGTDGMARQQQLLTDHFTKLGATVSRQSFQVRHPEQGTPVELANLIVEWHPERTTRILLCAHYDTRPYPDRDARRPRGLFVGANDGASGVAVLMELGQHMARLDGPIGVDFVLFDGEELVYDDQRDSQYYFLGSTHFATVYARTPPPIRYVCGVLLDMVGDARLELYKEKNSLHHARDVVNEVWSTARRLGVSEFIDRPRHEIRDDHLPLNEIARIPTCDIIDFDYPRPLRLSYWHTEADRPDKCSPASLAKVGWVISEWLKSRQTAN